MSAASLALATWPFSKVAHENSSRAPSDRAAPRIKRDVFMFSSLVPYRHGAAIACEQGGANLTTPPGCTRLAAGGGYESTHSRSARPGGAGCGRMRHVARNGGSETSDRGGEKRHLPAHRRDRARRAGPGPLGEGSAAGRGRDPRWSGAHLRRGFDHHRLSPGSHGLRHGAQGHRQGDLGGGLEHHDHGGAGRSPT